MEGINIFIHITYWVVIKTPNNGQLLYAVIVSTTLWNGCLPSQTIIFTLTHTLGPRQQWRGRMPVDNQERDIVLVPEFIHLLGYLRQEWWFWQKRHCTGFTIHPMVNIFGWEAAYTSKMHEVVLPLKPNARDVRQFRQEKARDMPMRWTEVAISHQCNKIKLRDAKKQGAKR